MIVSTKEQYNEVIQLAVKDVLVSIDTETQEFNEERTQAFELDLDGVGLYSENVAAYIPQKFLDKSFQEVIDKCELIFHNAKFDLTILEKEGYDISKINFHDTMIIAWMLNENRMSFALKSLAGTVLKVKKEEIQEFRNVKKRPIHEDYSSSLFPELYEEDKNNWLNELGKYCIKDCQYTYKLFTLFKPELEEQGLMNVYTNLELPTVLYLRDMENRGIKVDLEYMKAIKIKMEQKLIELQSTLYKLVGTDFDLNSPKRLVEIFFSKDKGKGYDLPPELKTAKGGLSTNVYALKYLVEKYKCPIATNLLLYREMFKLYSAYAVGLMKKNKNGVIHTSFIQQGTVTGRFSSREPNLQQLPRRDDEFNIREAFVPRDGYTFVISDLSQIELRLAAHFSQDPILVGAYADGKDIHQETADILGVNRNIAKTVNFGILYGRTAYGMAKGLGMNPDEAQKFIDNYFKKFHNLYVFMEQAKNTLRKDYKLKTILGRYRRFPDYAKAKRERDNQAMSRMERQAINSVVQGSAADIIKVQMRNLARKLKEYDCHMLVQVHDELIIECPTNLAEKVEGIVKYEMENAVKLNGVPIITEPHIAKRWKK